MKPSSRPAPSEAEIATRLREAAARANAEADARRAAAQETKLPKEIGGPAGAEPTRFGDWEKNGIASDF